MANPFDRYDGDLATAPAQTAPANPFDKYDDHMIPQPSASAAQPVEAAPSGGSWWTRVAWPNLRYVGGMLGLGALESGEALGQAEYQSQAGALGAFGQDVPPWQPYNPSQFVFGTPTPPAAPSIGAAYAGAVARSFGQNPVLGAAFPGTTIGGALGGEAGQQLAGAPGRVAGALIGGGLAGLGGGIVKSVLGWKSGDLPLLADSLGNSNSLTEAGTMLRTQAQDAIANKGELMDHIYGPVWNQLEQLAPGAKPPIALPHVEDAFRDILKLGSGDRTAQEMAKAAGGGAAWRQWQILSGAIGGPSAKLPSGLRAIDGGAPGGIAPQALDTAYQGMRQMGEGMTDAAIKGMGEANVRRLYRAYQDDFRDYFEQFGLDQQWNQANATAQMLNRDMENHVQPIANAKTAADAAKVAMQGANSGGERLGTIQDLLGKRATDELAAAHLTQSPKGWARLSEEAKQVLVPDAVHRQRIDSAVADLSAKPAGLAELVGASVSPITSGEVFGGPLGHLITGTEGGRDIGEIIAGAAPIAAYIAARQPKYLPNLAVGGMAGAGNLLTGPASESGQGR